MNISANSVGKRFNREWIFKNLNYEFESGHTYAITGPNGSGKSTLLQLLWGQLPPTQGTVTYHNPQTVAIEDIYKLISISTPSMELIEEFTLLEMVRFHYRFKKARNGASAIELLDRMELSHAADKFITNFSSGMRQRLKLGLAFCSETPVIFLDEPTNHLDKKSVEWYWRELHALPNDALIIIASNHEHEYPDSSKKIQISAYR